MRETIAIIGDELPKITEGSRRELWIIPAGSMEVGVPLGNYENATGKIPDQFHREMNGH